MKEQDYINVKALGTITAAINTLRDLPLKLMPKTIEDGEGEALIETLYKWQDKLFRQIDTEE